MSNLNQKKYIVGFLIIISLIFTGCSNNSSIQSESGGIITGTAQITAHNKITVPSLNQKLQIKEDDYSNSFPSIKPTVTNSSEYIVKFTKNLKTNYINRKILKEKGRIINKIETDIFVIEKTKEGLVSSLLNNYLVNSVEPNYQVHIQSIPDDTKYYQQWNLKMLNLEKTWNQYKGSRSITVAVLDTGILTDHSDLKDNLTSGYDFVDEDRDPTDTSSDFSHGTHVTGIIGAVTNNGRGIAGINWQVKIMPVRVIGPEGNGGYDNLIAGIRWATDNGADIINMSLGGSVDSSLLRDAIQYAVNKNVTVVAAAGNYNSTPILYPAKYSTVISVGAIGPSKKRAYYSNYGPDLDLVAPGGNVNDNRLSYPQNQILSTGGPARQYAWKQGTSMATPHVSGLIALLYSKGIKNPAQIKNLLKKTADDLGVSGTDEKYGAGLININRALNIDHSNLPDIKSDSDKQDNKTEITVNDIKIFAIKNNAENLNPVTTIIHPQSSGNFSLETPPGTWSIVAWLDINGSNKLDSGDYFDRKDNIKVKSNQETDNLKLELGEIRP